MTPLALLDFREPHLTEIPPRSLSTPFGAVRYQETPTGFLMPAAAADPRANAYAARWLGAERVIAVLAEPSLSQPVLPVDFIEFTSGRLTTFFETAGAGYVQQSPPFCPELTAALASAGAAPQGLLLILDQLPQPAVREWWRNQGVDYFTTWSQPDGALCRELEMCWATLLTPPGFDVWAWLGGVALPAARTCPCPQTMQFARQSDKLPADWRRWVTN